MANATGRIVALSLFTILTLGSPLSDGALAQSVQGSPEDLDFEIINATTGQPGTIEKLEIHYSTERLNPVLEIAPEGSKFTVPEVPIKDIGRYVITAWKDGVPYFWSIRGSQLLEGPVTLHVFDTIESLDDVTVTGLNLLVQVGESVVQLEYLIKLDNAARPQATVVGQPSLEINVPDEATGFSAHYTRGPEPTEIPVSKIGTSRLGLNVPLTTGQNQIRLVCSAPWREGMTLAVGANVPVQAWSLLASPENLDIQAMELEPDHSQDLPGYLRFRGPTLESGRKFDITVRGRVPAGPEEDVFQAEAPAEREAQEKAAAEEKGGNSFPLSLTVPIMVVLIIIIVRRRRS